MTIRAAIIEGSPTPLQARIERTPGGLLKPADVDQVQWKAWPLDSDGNIVNPATPIDQGNLPPEVIFDPVRTAGWSVDTEGYNFEHVVTGPTIEVGGRTVRVEHVVKQIGASPDIPLEWYELTVRDGAFDGIGG